MNEIKSSPSWDSSSPIDAQRKPSSVRAAEHRQKIQNNGHSYTPHTPFVEQQGEVHTGTIPQVQIEKKTEDIRKTWVETPVSTPTGRKKSVISFIGEKLKHLVTIIKLAVSSLFASKGIKTTQLLLNSKELKQTKSTDETLTLENGRKFSLPQQFNRDLAGCRYFLGNDDLLEKSIEDLKAKDIKANKDPEVYSKTDSTVRLNAGLMLENKFGNQGLLNIASILNQAPTPDLQSRINKMGEEHYGKEAGSKNATSQSLPEFFIKEEGDRVRLSMMIYLAVYPLGSDGLLDIALDPTFVIAKREIVMSKEDLQKDWTGHAKFKIAPSMKVADSYSEFHLGLNDAKKEMGLIRE